MNEEVKSTLIRVKNEDGSYKAVFPVNTIDDVYTDIENDKTLREKVQSLDAISKWNTPTYTIDTSQTAVVNGNPIPTTGWLTTDAGLTYYVQNPTYMVYANSRTPSYETIKMFDNNLDTFWAPQISPSSSAHCIIYFPEKIKIQKVKMQYNFSTGITELRIEGSNNSTSWTSLYSVSTPQVGRLTNEVTLTTTGMFSYYRILITSAGQSTVTFNEFQISSYETNVRTVKYSLSNIPSTFENNQKVSVLTPTVNTVGVSGNTLNNVAIDRILESNKQYELRYLSNKFYAKEV